VCTPSRTTHALTQDADLIRWETLALHQADTPQFYPECAQLLITGSGTVFPTSDYIKTIPGAWGGACISRLSTSNTDANDRVFQRTTLV
jgi:hypothetical protein